MLDVERWAEIRRMHFVEGLSLREIARRTGRDRKTVRRAVRSREAPSYACSTRPSKLDPFKDDVHHLLRDDPRLPAVRVRELIEPLGFTGGQTIVDSYLRDVRPIFLPARTFQRTTYRPGEILQFDLFHPRQEIPVGHGQTRQGYVLVAALGYSGAAAGALVFSKQASDLLWALGRCLERLGGLPKLLVTDREGSLHRGGGRPTEDFARFCGELRLGWHICRERDPEAKGLIENRQRFMRQSFEPGRSFANQLDFQDRLDRWFEERANASTHRTLRCRPRDRLPEELRAMAALPEAMPDTDRRLVTRVPQDPYVRFDTCDYSLDPRLVGRRVEVRISQREVRAVALDTGELAARHERSFARHRTITALAKTEDGRTSASSRSMKHKSVGIGQRPREKRKELVLSRPRFTGHLCGERDDHATST